MPGSLARTSGSYAGPPGIWISLLAGATGVGAAAGAGTAPGVGAPDGFGTGAAVGVDVKAFGAAGGWLVLAQATISKMANDKPRTSRQDGAVHRTARTDVIMLLSHLLSNFLGFLWLLRAFSTGGFLATLLAPQLF